MSDQSKIVKQGWRKGSEHIGLLERTYVIPSAYVRLHVTLDPGDMRALTGTQVHIFTHIPMYTQN